MPYEWTQPDGQSDAEMGPDLEALRLWPHRSMTNGGFATFIGATFALACIPLIAVLGSPIMWGLLPFLMGTLALTWAMIRRNDKDRSLTEELTLAADRVTLVRTEARGAVRRWEANPHWVRVSLHERSGPVEAYVTLSGGDREVEIGAFLSPDERRDLFEDLTLRLGQGLGAGPEGGACQQDRSGRAAPRPADRD